MKLDRIKYLNLFEDCCIKCKNSCGLSIKTFYSATSAIELVCKLGIVKSITQSDEKTILSCECFDEKEGLPVVETFKPEPIKEVIVVEAEVSPEVIKSLNKMSLEENKYEFPKSTGLRKTTIKRKDL